MKLVLKAIGLTIFRLALVAAILLGCGIALDGISSYLAVTKGELVLATFLIVIGVCFLVSLVSDTYGELAAKERVKAKRVRLDALRKDNDDEPPTGAAVCGPADGIYG